MSLLARLADRGPAPVFALIGPGGRMHARGLLADSRVCLVRSPRHATVLLVFGDLPEALHEPARLVHDQVPNPRATIVLDVEGQEKAPFAGAEVVREPAAIPGAAVKAHRDLMSHRRQSGRCLGPEENPVEWQGVGPHGQGGEGMMGGTPYGRSMAMTGPEVRDGLQLDRVELPLGPFLRWLPPGLCIDLVLQGDVVQEARLGAVRSTQRDGPEIFERALHEEVPLAKLELERARHHLFAIVDLLSLHGLEAQAARVARRALELRGHDGDAMRNLTRWLRWTGALRMGTRGVGVLDAATVEGSTGPVARASGVERDARTDDPAYRDLGFTPVTHQAGDSEARWQQRLAEAAQSLWLARSAGGRLRRPGPPLEGPRGVVDGGTGARFHPLLDQVSVGQAFDAFVTTLVSLDLDPRVLPPRSGSGDDGDEGQGGDGEDGPSHNRGGSH